MPFRLQIPRRMVDEMVAQAVAELPNECCGLLAGTIVAGRGIVEQHYPLVNAAASPRAFESQPESQFAAHKDMRQRGLDVLAIYHSHPTSPPIPSRTDLEHNWTPDVVNFIISLEKNKPVVRGWWLTTSEYREAEWEIVE
jgi:proteasome lid subunit RPN8/RPN11